MLPAAPSQTDLAGFSSGDLRARQRVLAPWIPIALAWWARLGGTRAETDDSVQAALAAVASGLMRGEPPERLGSSVFRELRRELSARRRSRFLRRLLPGSTPELTDETPRLEETAARAASSLDRLAFEPRAVLVLVDGEGTSVPEAAELLGLSVPSFARALDRARLALAKVNGGTESDKPWESASFRAFLAETVATVEAIDRLSKRLDEDLERLPGLGTGLEIAAMSRGGLRASLSASGWRFVAGAGLAAGILAALMVALQNETETKRNGTSAADPPTARPAEEVPARAVPDAPPKPAAEPLPTPSEAPPPRPTIEATSKVEPAAPPPPALIPEAPRARARKVEVSGFVTAAQAEAGISTRAELLSDCYSKSQLGPLAGRELKLNFFVLAEGTVRSVTALPDDEAARAMADCVSRSEKKPSFEGSAAPAGSRQFSVVTVSIVP